MTASYPGRLARLAAWALFVLIGLGVVAPKSVLAGCGHSTYLKHSRPGWDSFRIPELFQPDNLQVEDRSPSVPPLDRPCSGPTCSKAPGLPIVPASRPLARTDSWCFATAVLSLFSPTLLDEIVELAPRRPISISTGIERPPRLLIHSATH